ncbi:MAG: 50S ribosomal protein L18 [Candidatus Zixiibacteriota bacterium]|nr:MAG: 50S ribosomal protein L18 [candidate division Zixibacteria bacterium]
MADKNIVKTKKAIRRRKRVRGKVSGTAGRPRLTVAKSLKNIFVQVVDDENHNTLISAASNSKGFKAENKKATKTEVAKKVGIMIAQLAKEKGIEAVVFDRNQNRYHGRIKAVAEGAREGGLKF